jgi:hypothetical protein
VPFYFHYLENLAILKFQFPLWNSFTLIILLTRSLILFVPTQFPYLRPNSTDSSCQNLTIFHDQLVMTFFRIISLRSLTKIHFIGESSRE